MASPPAAFQAPLLIALWREEAGLKATVSELTEAGAATFRTLPLGDLPLALLPARNDLLRDWCRLAQARDLQTVWPAFWRVFWASLAANAGQGTPELPEKFQAVARPAPTAAHPRAFRGTKYQPPKPTQPALDLCTWMAEDRLLDAMFQRLEAVPLILSPDSAEASFPHTTPLCVSRLLAWRMGSADGAAEATPPAFRDYFDWTLRTQKTATRLAWLNIWRALGCPDNGQRLALSARLCALAPTATWCGALLPALPAERQIPALHAILQYQTYQQSANCLHPEQLAALSAETPDDERFAVYINALLGNLRRGVNAAYTLAGCMIATTTRESTSFCYLNVEHDCTDLPMADVQRMLAAAGADLAYWGTMVWELCGKFPGFSRVLRDTDWSRVDPGSIGQWLGLFHSVTGHEDEWSQSRQLAHGKALLEAFAPCHAAMIRLSGKSQNKFVHMLRLIYDDWDSPNKLMPSLRYMLPLLTRLSQPPFSPDRNPGGILSNLIPSQTEEGLKVLSETADPIWLAVEKAIRRDNDDTLITRGFYALTRARPEWTLNALQKAPGALLRTAHLLGGLGYDHRRQFLAYVLQHSAWFTTDWQTLPPLEACRRIYTLSLKTGISSPLPRRLRDYLENRLTLRPGQLDRHVALTLQRLLPTQLRAIEEAMWEYIDKPYQWRHRSAAAAHAVRLAASLDAKDNGRGLRRALRHYAESDKRFAHLDHPLNQAWFAAHPRIDRELWCHTSLQQQYGEITLGLETDPLEILMLGTYTGTCLGLGGLCDYSAAACLLDANKQVIYARDARGRVIARQLLGIDEKERLVSFTVYPLETEKGLQKAFLEYDKTLASKLGLERYQDDDAGYDLTIILASYAWDDGAWDLDEAGLVA
jgi:hypothetical protein